MPKFAINSVRSVHFISYPQTIASLAKTDHPNLSTKTKNIDIDDDMDLGSDCERYELNLKKKVHTNSRNMHRKIKEATKSSDAWDQRTDEHHQSVSEFEDSY